MSSPETWAWFYHRIKGQRRLGVFDPGSGQSHDLGPRCELTMLAAGELEDLGSLPAQGQVMAEPPEYDVPVARPGKILCLGKNYAAHAAEFGAEPPEEPIIFAKLGESLLPHRKAIVLPYWLESRVDHEIELAVVLGFQDPKARGRKHVSASEAMQLVSGFTVLNDVTARRMQGDDRDRKHPWLRSKSFDSFCPMGPWVVPKDCIENVHDLQIRLWVDGELRQDSRTSHMTASIPQALEYLSRHTTLRPGDILATGTPAGVGPIVEGNLVTGRIEGIGELVNPVVREEYPVAP